MNKFNKSKIALLLALTSVFTGGNKSSASLVGDICDITAVTTSNISAGLAMKSKSTAGTVVATVSTIGLPIILFTGGYFWSQKVERDELANSIISSLRNKGKLTDIRQSFAKSKSKLDEILKKSNSNIVFNEKKIEIMKFNPEAVNVGMCKNFVNNLSSELEELLDEAKNQNNKKVIEEKAKNLDDNIMKSFPGVKFNTQLNSDTKQKILTSDALDTLIQNYSSTVEVLNKDYNFPKVCRYSGVPSSISVCKNEQGKLSSVYSMNFDITDSSSYSNKHNICFRMSDKFELLIDGHSYDVN